MYQAYLNTIRPGNTPVSAPEGGGCAVGRAHEDPGAAMNAIRNYHASYHCDVGAEYFIAGPDGEVVAYVTLPAALSTR